MKRLALLTAAAGLAAATFATSASAQYPYPNPYPSPYPSPYPNQYPYGNTGQNVIGSIINSVLGYGQYPYGNYGYGQPGYQSQQVAVSQCARAVEARLNNYAMNDGYNRWNPYNNPYSGWARQGQARVLGIDDVRIRKSDRIRVRGVATSGNVYAQGYGYGGYQYNRQYGTPDLRFTCNADRRGRVYDVDIDRMSYYGRWR
jgi:hypothetical protein